ncbi:50S ribosomal protein L4 [bacterium]|nr:50S ribosomal protein L4 [bacterium]
MARTVKLKELPELGISTPNQFHVQESYLRQVRHGLPATARKKRKSDVQATGAKWYRQKGTGRARQGEQTNPHMTGGGLAFPPLHRLRKTGLNKHIRKSALRSAVLLHIEAETAYVVQGQDFEKIAKTKEAAEIVAKLSEYETICLVASPDSLLWRSARNIWNVRLVAPRFLNVRDLVESSRLVFSQTALDEFKKYLNQHNEPADEEETAAPTEAGDDVEDGGDA